MENLTRVCGNGCGPANADVHRSTPRSGRLPQNLRVFPSNAAVAADASVRLLSEYVVALQGATWCEGTGCHAHAAGALCEERDRRRGHRSEEHTSELQSPCNLVCRLLLE